MTVKANNLIPLIVFPLSVTFFLSFFYGGKHFGYAQILILGSLLLGLREPYVVAGLKPGLAMYQAISLPTILPLQPPFFAFSAVSLHLFHPGSVCLSVPL